MSKSIFSQILIGEIPSTILFENKYYFVIKDINPKSKTHLLIISKKEIKTLNDLDPKSKTASAMIKTIHEVSKLLEIPEYKIQINCGKSAGQEVFHLHIHFQSPHSLKETLKT